MLDVMLVSVPSEGAILGADSLLPMESLGITTLARCLQSQGYAVKVVDGELGMDLEMVRRIVLATEAPFVGFSTFQNTMAATLALAAEYKTRYPHTTICLGGYQATFCAGELLEKEPAVDVVVVGRGEAVIGNLVLEARTRGPMPKQIVLGTSQGLPPELTDPQARWPWRDPATLRRRGAAAVLGSEGCYGQCTFCTNPQFEALGSGPRWRPRPDDDLIEEMRTLHGNYGVTHFEFYDPDFLSMGKAAHDRSATLAHRIASLSFKTKIRFTAQAKAAASLPPEFWALWKSAGLERVYIGFESGDDRSLLSYGKYSRRDHNLRALALLQEQGIAVQIGFIMYKPDTTLDDIRSSVDFLREVGQGYFFKHLANSLIIYPGTKEFDWLREEGRLQLQDSKSYRGVSYEYKYPEVARVVEAVLAVRGGAYHLDRLLLDLEFGLVRGGEVVTQGDLHLDHQSGLALFEGLKVERAESISRYFGGLLVGNDMTSEFLKRDGELYAQAMRAFRFP